MNGSYQWKEQAKTSRSVDDGDYDKLRGLRVARIEKSIELNRWEREFQKMTGLAGEIQDPLGANVK